MNEENFNKGIKELKNIRLSQSEKESILKKAMASPVESPYVKRSSLIVSIFVQHARVLVAASLVLLMSFGGAIYASDDALPGDILYTVKTAMVEPVLDIVYASPEKKLVWEEEKVERRIVEAEKLIEKDELDEEKLAKLEIRIEKSSAAFAAAASRFASSNATSSASKVEREKKIKADFRAKINERRVAFDDGDEEKAEGVSASATMMMSVPVDAQDRVLNELTDKDKNRSGKNLNKKEKIERLKRAATRNLNGDSDDSNDDEDSDDDFVDGVKLRGDGSADDNGGDDDNDDDEDDKLEVEVEIKIEDINL